MRPWPRWRSVNARAQDYEDSGAFGDTPLDVLRAYAYLDLLNGVTPEARIACAEARDEAADAAEALAWAEARAARHRRPPTAPDPGPRGAAATPATAVPAPAPAPATHGPGGGRTRRRHGAPTAAAPMTAARDPAAA